MKKLLCSPEARSRGAQNQRVKFDGQEALNFGVLKYTATSLDLLLLLPLPRRHVNTNNVAGLLASPIGNYEL
jgi:hypothetical protein